MSSGQPDMTIPREGEPTIKMSDAEFGRISEIVFQLSGIVIKEHKRDMIHARISRRLRARDMPSFGAYLSLLDGPEGASELGDLINAVTTNLTSFFREGHHFDDLRDNVLGPMAAAGARRARIWSSACSSGEEPYTIAMTVRSNDAIAQIPDLKLLATDLDTNMLSKAQAGRYNADRIAQIPAELKRRFLNEKPDGDFEFSNELKAIISFKQLNLLGEWPMRGPFDAIFCRNVLIYFDAPTKKRLVDQMAQMVRPGGALYLGHSESLLGEHPLLTSEGRTIYRRKA